MKANTANRYWGDVTPPKSKAEFFNAVTAPAASGDGAVATIRMYGPIDSWGGWWGISTKDIGAVLDALPDTVTQIVLRINSPGGEVFEALAILNMLRAHKAKITAVVDGLAASAASVIAAAADETVMSPGTQMMIHSPWVITWGSAADLRKTANVLDGIEASLIEIYTGKAGAKDWVTLLAEDTWLTAAQSVEIGLADRIAVIPDAGETETVGADQLDEDDDVENSISIAIGVGAMASSFSASKLPSSSEPGDPNRKDNAMAYGDLQAGLRERLGVTDAEASDDALLAAVDQALEDATSTGTVTAGLPDGVVAIDAAVLADLQAKAAQGVEALTAQTEARREGILEDAMKDGRIMPQSRAKWAALLEKDEAGTTALLADLPKNSVVPVDELGHASGEDSDAERIYSMAFGKKEEVA